MSESDSFSAESDAEDTYESDGGYSFTSPQRGSKDRLGEGFQFQSFSPAELEENRNNEAADLVELLGLRASVVSVLLLQFRWNRERLIDAYMDSPTTIIASGGDATAQEPPPSKRPRTITLKFVCDVCCDAPPESETYEEKCGHKFCTACWQAYIASKVNDEGQCLVTCMQESCPVVLDEHAIQRFADTKCYERYRTLVNELYVNVRSDLRFCPFPGCNQVLSCHGATPSTLLARVPAVTCAMSHTFCFGCHMNVDHRPVICAMADLWSKNVRADSGSSQWIMAHTKPCPKCNNATEKNGGCNRLLCRQCQFQWCWMCQKNWNVHGYGSACNAYVEPAREERSQARVNLEKWLFYYDRFTNHELSSKLDQDLYSETEKKMVEIQNTSGLSWIEASFMKNAVDELTKCRATLKWSYVMAFYIQKSNMKEIFEDVQADLETAVEALSQMLEEKISAESVHDLRQRMLDKTAYVQKRHLILLEDTAKGLQEGRWKWTVPVEL